MKMMSVFMLRGVQVYVVQPTVTISTAYLEVNKSVHESIKTRVYGGSCVSGLHLSEQIRAELQDALKNESALHSKNSHGKLFPEYLKGNFLVDMHICHSPASPKSTIKPSMSLANKYFPDNKNLTCGSLKIFSFTCIL